MTDFDRLKKLAGLQEDSVAEPKFVVHVDRYDGTAEGVAVGDFMEELDEIENMYEKTTGSSGASGAPYRTTVTYNGEEDMFILFY